MKLEAYGANKLQIEEWQRQWAEATIHNRRADPLPCPKCFLDGLAPTGLTPLIAKEEVARVKCRKCKRYFEYPDE